MIMRLSSALNWTLLCLNTVLTLFLISALLFSQGGLGVNSAAYPLPDNIADLGMDVYCEKDPFVLFADKEFPSTQSFMLVQRDQPVSMSVSDIASMGGPATNSASVGMGPDFSISFDYSLADGSVRVHQLMLCH